MEDRNGVTSDASDIGPPENPQVEALTGSSAAASAATNPNAAAATTDAAASVAAPTADGKSAATAASGTAPNGVSQAAAHAAGSTEPVATPAPPAAYAQPATPEEQLAIRLLHGLGYCGHYLHYHRGGRSGRSPMLCVLANNGGSMSQQELGLYFELKPGSLSEMLSKLESDGLIVRTRDERDRRQLNVHLTPAGQDQAQSELEATARFHEECFTCLTREEQLQLANMLDRIKIHWEGLD